MSFKFDAHPTRQNGQQWTKINLLSSKYISQPTANEVESIRSSAGFHVSKEVKMIIFGLSDLPVELSSWFTSIVSVSPS